MRDELFFRSTSTTTPEKATTSKNAVLANIFNDIREQEKILEQLSGSVQKVLLRKEGTAAPPTPVKFPGWRSEEGEGDEVLPLSLTSPRLPNTQEGNAEPPPTPQQVNVKSQLRDIFENMFLNSVNVVIDISPYNNLENLKEQLLIEKEIHEPIKVGIVSKSRAYNFLTEKGITKELGDFFSTNHIGATWYVLIVPTLPIEAPSLSSSEERIEWAGAALQQILSENQEISLDIWDNSKKRFTPAASLDKENSYIIMFRFPATGEKEEWKAGVMVTDNQVRDSKLDHIYSEDDDIAVQFYQKFVEKEKLGRKWVKFLQPVMEMKQIALGKTNSLTRRLKCKIETGELLNEDEKAIIQEKGEITHNSYVIIDENNYVPLSVKVISRDFGVSKGEHLRRDRLGGEGADRFALLQELKIGVKYMYPDPQEREGWKLGNDVSSLAYSSPITGLAK